MSQLLSQPDMYILYLNNKDFFFHIKSYIIITISTLKNDIHIMCMTIFNLKPLFLKLLLVRLVVPYFMYSIASTLKFSRYNKK